MVSSEKRVNQCHYCGIFGIKVYRTAKKPKDSILLFGPRGTGKSRWIKQHFSHVQGYNLLETQESLCWFSRLVEPPELAAVFYGVRYANQLEWWDTNKKAPSLAGGGQ